MRSTTETIFSAAIISRRSSAIGARSAMVWTASCSTSASSASIFLSPSTTCAARLWSPLPSAVIAWSSACSARPPISLIRPRRRFRSSSKALTVCSLTIAIVTSFRGYGSAITPGDIILGAVLLRVGEDIGGLAIFDQRPEVEKGGALRHAGRLLHIVGDDHDRIFPAELVG